MDKITILLSFLLISYSTTFAQKSEIFIYSDAAIHGYDPLAYFKESKPVKGDKKYTYSWKEASWYFSSQQNLDAFKTNPDYYAPQYGGYYAYGLADGHKLQRIRQAWTIVNNK